MRKLRQIKGEKQIKARLKVWLMLGKKISHNQAQKLWHTNRLASYIHRLRKDGLKIQKKMIITPRETYAIYFHQL